MRCLFHLLLATIFPKRDSKKEGGILEPVKLMSRSEVQLEKNNSKVCWPDGFLGNLLLDKSKWVKF